MILTLLTGNMVESKKKTDNCLPKQDARNMDDNMMIPSTKAFKKHLKSKINSNGATEPSNVTYV